MGRPLKGPVRIGNAPTWYARLTVKPADRQRAGTTRLHKSLGTTDYNTALQRWSEAYKSLQDELRLKLGAPIEDHALIRARLDAGYASEMITPDGVETLSDHDQAAQILNVQALDEDNPLHEEVFNAVTTGSRSLATWDLLIDNHVKVKTRKTGRQPSASTSRKTKAAVKEISEICPYPSQLDKAKVKEMVNYYESLGKKPSTISCQLGLVSGLVTSAIKSDLLEIEVNPFGLVDFSAITSEEDSRKEFSSSQIKILIADATYGGAFRLMIATGMRIGELLFRNYPDDLSNEMLIIRDNPKLEWKPKTRSSYRRVPIDAQGLDDLERLYAIPHTPRTKEGHLRATVRKYFDEKSLVVHSCRHSFKTLARVTGVDLNVSDEISGHAKQMVSKTSDCYGSYPDDLLKKESKKVYDYLDNL